MNHAYALFVALAGPVVLVIAGSRFSYSWPWYTCAAIVVTACAYRVLEPGVR